MRFTNMNLTIKTGLFLLLLGIVLPYRLASAQVDLTGEWAPRVYNEAMDIGDYTGIPLNEAGRLRAETWHPEQLDLPENLCRPDRRQTFQLRGAISSARRSPMPK